MNKNDLIKAVAEKTGLTSKRALGAVDAVFEIIIEGVAANHNVRLMGFGTFHQVKREARMGRNPRTGESLKIKPSRLPRFKAGKSFKDAVASL
jgi:DNA-binding protein HU-beta